MRCIIVVGLLGLAVLGTAVEPCGATSPTADEMAAAGRFAAAKFAVEPSAPSVASPGVGLRVLANNDPVQKNARNGRPLRIGDRRFTRGLFCHAVSKVLVRLPGPAASFCATVGVDTNPQTVGGRGSVVFAVRAGGSVRFQSTLMKEGTPAVAVKADLGGASELTLEVADGGDGIACDQADWAEARATLVDGRVVWLDELPVLDPVAPVSTAPPFSFSIDGRPSTEWLSKRPPVRASRALDARRTEHTLTWRDAATGLVVRCAAVAYRDFPVVEWTVYFRNEGERDTPILSDVLSLDLPIERFPWPSQPWSEFVLHHAVGSPCEPRDYQPLRTLLEPEKTKQIAALGGRPSNSDLPYFNIELPTSEGLIVAVGWPGQWAARFVRDKQHTLRVLAGQERTRFRLRPGEEVRTPLTALLFWKGTAVRSQNLWRRWMLAHNVPRPGGKLPPVQMAACSSHQFGEMIHADTASQKLFIDRYVEERLGLDYWWMDAGWYWNKTGWTNTGTWEVDTKRFPGGLRPICDHAHRKNVRTILWFEPERVTAGTWLTENHPEWILSSQGGGKGGSQGGLLNLGNDAARTWLINHVDALLTREAIDLYRQDFNMDPLELWRAADAPDRVGVTEMKHVAGYLAYWDALRHRHPNMLIDTCASGGRRNDLETLRRSVPLLRSDYIVEPVGNQAHTYGISSWIPYYGTGTGSGALSPYLIRSTMCPHFTACFDVRRRDLDYAMLRRVLGQWRRYAPYYFGDFYPLTPYSLEPTAWIGWQFDCPEKGEGVIQAFRRDESVYEAARLEPQALDPAARYELTDLDSGKSWTVAGRTLCDEGLAVSINTRPGDAVIVYRKLAAGAKAR